MAGINKKLKLSCESSTGIMMSQERVANLDMLLGLTDEQNTEKRFVLIQDAKDRNEMFHRNRENCELVDHFVNKKMVSGELALKVLIEQERLEKAIYVMHNVSDEIFNKYLQDVAELCIKKNELSELVYFLFDLDHDATLDTYRLLEEARKYACTVEETTVVEIIERYINNPNDRPNRKDRLRYEYDMLSYIDAREEQYADFKAWYY